MARATTVVIAAGDPVLRGIADALTLAGYAVTDRCGTLAEALDAVRRCRPDVCVVDRGISDGGLSAIAAVAGSGRRPRVVVVGGRSAAEIRAVRMAGAAACVPGTDAIDVVAAVAAAVARGTRSTGGL